MAFAFILLFSLPGYFYRFYKYVWQFYDDHTDYAVALWMYVYHSSRGEINAILEGLGITKRLTKGLTKEKRMLK